MENRALLQRWAPIPLRLIVGYGFLMHGLLKLGRGVAVFAAALGGLHVPAPQLMAGPFAADGWRRQRARFSAR